MHNLDQKISQVLCRLGEQADKERSGQATIPESEMMLAITSDTGVYFNIMLKAINAKRILEVGTSTGYSTLWFVDAIKYNNSDHAKPIITIDENPAKTNRARKNFEEAGVDSLIDVRRGTAIDVLKEMQASYDDTPFDFVFIDADKENAINYFDLVFPMVRTGGIIAADNILHPENLVAEMSKYSRYVKGRPDAESVTVPIGMGEEITIKLRP
ncbi:O-methyltransferase [Nitrososphaera sp.]|uniref:O-methyltransferase n=1 Tax=Nitrososphaera sp. TaxID=1971748 RepID=UPI0017AB1CB0|nr:O-methyltransferase [Nitrososphaera sp.]NWG37559.1 O-methyltransferase [Nitrososphaera sp.]